MSRVLCLYCDAANDAVRTAGFCESCGRKLPPASRALGRRAGTLREGDASQLDAPASPMSQSANMIFLAGIVNLLGNGAVLMLAPLLVAREQLPAEYMPGLIGASLVVLIVLGGLGWWARTRPVPATIAATLVYPILACLDAFAAPALALRSIPLKLVVFAMLLMAVRVSRRPRRLADM